MRSTAAILISARGVRGFGDGLTALLLPAYLIAVGFGPAEVGALTTATLLGSAALTLAVSQLGWRLGARRILLAACGLMLATGVAFSQLYAFWPLVVAGFLGTLNPSGGDVSVFLPVEQAMLAQAAAPGERTATFARYGLTGAVTASLGALAVAAIEPLQAATGASAPALMQAAFLLYGLLAVAAFGLYRRLPPAPAMVEPPAPLGPSRRQVLALAALFSVDSFGGGFLVQSLMALWLFQRFDLSLASAGAFFFWTGLLSATSQLASAPLARRIGLINTMVFTHIPANLCAVAAAFAPDAGIALALLSVRALLSSMDVPARTSYVMAVVTPAERAAAAGITNVPRSLASAASPSLAGLLYGVSAFAWPLVIGGALKTAYDLMLLAMFRRVRPPEEQD
jgi:MFS family permease